MPVRLNLSHHEADQLVRLIDEKDEPLDEVVLKEIKRRIQADEDPRRVRRKDLEMVLDMVPTDWHEIHVLTSACHNGQLTKSHMKDCLGCKLTTRREKAVKRLRTALGMEVK